MRLSQRSGFSLIELIITLTLLGIVMTAVTNIVVNMQRGYVRQREVVTADEALRVAETTISSALRMAGANPMNIAGVAAPVFDPNPLGSGTYDNLRVAADFNPVDGVLTSPLEDVLLYTQADTMFVRWQAGQVAAPVVYPIRSLLFEYDSSGTTLTNAVVIARAANRVKITITAPRHQDASALARRVIWIHLRNRS